MELHFDFKGLFLFCVGLMICQMLYGMAFESGVVGLWVWLAYLRGNKKIRIQDLVFAIGFLVNLRYVSALGENIHQYDYYNYYSHGMFFVENDFFINNPVDYIKGAFFHPPLWGGISGVVIKIGNLLGIEDVLAYDKVRFINLFAIAGVWVVSWKFFNLFDFRKEIVLWGWGLFVFLPIHTILAGLNNNDPLMYLFMCGAIYQGYLWYGEEKGRKRSFVIAGLVIGAGMTKLSGVMVIVFLSMLGLGKLINKKVIFDKKLWGDFLIIGLGGVIGFSWAGVLLYYGDRIVPPPMNVEFISLEGFSLWEKLFDFSGVFNIYPDIWNGILEHNVWLILIKSAVFGEWSWKCFGACLIMYVLAIGIALFLVYSFLGLFKYPLREDFGLNLAIIVYCFVGLLLWGGLWFRYPYFCSAEFRYIIGLVMVSVLWMMNWVERRVLSKVKLKIIACLIVCFCVAKVIVVVSSF